MPDEKQINSTFIFVKQCGCISATRAKTIWRIAFNPAVALAGNGDVLYSTF